jgi:pimeloyl-ACP methyl ester carboxylesterase
MCNENGWDFEEHTVTTEDGYILTLHRIPGKLLKKNNDLMPAALF